MSEVKAAWARAGNPDAGLVADLGARIDDALEAALDGAKEVALVNFHGWANGWPRWVGNPGDMAIWLGTLASLRRLGVRVAYQCAYNTLSLAALRRAVPHGPVLITGGGDFGDLYTFGTPETRERLLAELRGVRLIQLPIAVYFKQQPNIDRLRRLVTEHNNFILMVRDQLSEARAHEHLDADVRLVPDMAFGLGPLARPQPPDVDVLWNTWKPDDPEYVDHGPPPDGITTRTIEWASRTGAEPRWRWDRRAARRTHLLLGRWMGRWPSTHAPLWRAYAATFAPLCHGSVERGLRLESSGRVLVTNKLHGHVFAVLAGIPHVLLDNSFGKVSGLYQTWTKSSGNVHWADDGAAARAIAVELLRSVERV